jgi:hypothetical protein
MKVTLHYLVQADYLKVMKIPLERGRFLSPADHEHSPFVIVIDDCFAQRYFQGQNPIGKRVNFDILNATAEIVGVVGHVKQYGLEEDSTFPIQAQCYLQLSQLPDQFLSLMGLDFRAAVRTKGAPLTQVSAVRSALSQINSQQVMYNAETLDGVISDSQAARRFSMVLLGIFDALRSGMCCGWCLERGRRWRLWVSPLAWWPPSG